MRTLFCAALAGLAFAAPAEAQLLHDSKLYVGTLSCNVSGSVGFIFGSTKELSCVLVRPDGSSEDYGGKVNRFGIDIGFTKAMHVLWHVYSLSESAPAGALAGDYLGKQQSITLGGTAGSTVLVGGANGAIILDSVAIHGGHDGYNFADGLAEISLSQGGGL